MNVFTIKNVLYVHNNVMYVHNVKFLEVYPRVKRFIWDLKKILKYVI